MADQFINDRYRVKSSRPILEKKASVDLLEPIVYDRDRDVLNTLIGRPHFVFHGSGPFLLPDYLDRDLKWRISRKVVTDEIAAQAYELTLEKFTVLNPSGDSAGIDCHNQYSYLLSEYHSIRSKELIEDQIAIERWFGKAFQACVDRHLSFSIKEVIRINDPTTRRYEWRNGKKSLWLQIPSDLPARTIREWLKQSFPKGIPNDPEEIHQVQEAVWERFQKPRFTELKSTDSYLNPIKKIWDRIDCPEDRLMMAVTAEKMEHFDNLPARLRNFGKDGLRDLINLIFCDLCSDCFDAGQLSRDFEIPSSTFSKIAGPYWWKKIENGVEVDVPDLWANVIEVLTANEDFEDAILESGIQNELALLTERKANHE